MCAVTTTEQARKQLPANSESSEQDNFDVLMSSRVDIFDFFHIIPYLRKNGNRHPHTGVDLKPSDLIKLNFSKNDSGLFYCPITLKTFTEHSKIVANRRSGNVFSWDAVEKMNIQENYWFDLLTEEPFIRGDLIILQDPKNPKNYSESFNRETTVSGSSDQISDRVNLSGGIGKVLKELKMTEITKINQTSQNDDLLTTSDATDELHAFAPHTTGKLAASLTSTSMSLQTTTELALLDEAQTLLQHFPPGKETTATVCMRTNFGDLFFTLFPTKSPRSCYNFMELAKKGYFDGTTFHRFVKGFILQGGDPSGTGRGGESIWKKPFSETSLHPTLTHSERGVLSMANSGDPNSNNSQFFITLRSAPHLDQKHVIFGKILAGSDVLDAIEAEVEVDSSDSHAPLTKISIEDILVLEDPFEEAKKLLSKTKIITKNSNTKPNGPSKSLPQIGKYLVTKPTAKK